MELHFVDRVVLHVRACRSGSSRLFVTLLAHKHISKSSNRPFIHGRRLLSRCVLLKLWQKLIIYLLICISFSSWVYSCKLLLRYSGHVEMLYKGLLKEYVFLNLQCSYVSIHSNVLWPIALCILCLNKFSAQGRTVRLHYFIFRHQANTPYLKPFSDIVIFLTKQVILMFEETELLVVFLLLGFGEHVKLLVCLREFLKLRF